MKNLKIYIDFDGTIALKDIGGELSNLYEKFEPHLSQLKKEEFNFYEFWKILLKELNDNINILDINNQLERVEIDPYFIKFANYCKNHGIVLAIISDGFDIFIDYILKNHGIEWIILYCNKLIRNGKGKFEPFYMGTNESCYYTNASRKRNIIICNSAPEDIIAYIGDGYSDFCTAEHSDIIFAKGDLATYCNKNRLPHYPFSSFFDIQRILEDILKKNKIKIRYQAYLKRENAFKTE